MPYVTNIRHVEDSYIWFFFSLNLCILMNYLAFNLHNNKESLVFIANNINTYLVKEKKTQFLSIKILQHLIRNYKIENLPEYVQSHNNNGWISTTKERHSVHQLHRKSIWQILEVLTDKPNDCLKNKIKLQNKFLINIFFKMHKEIYK